MNGVAEKDHVYRPSITVSSLWKSRALESQSLLILLTVGSNKASLTSLVPDPLAPSCLAPV